MLTIRKYFNRMLGEMLPPELVREIMSFLTFGGEIGVYATTPFCIPMKPMRVVMGRESGIIDAFELVRTDTLCPAFCHKDLKRFSYDWIGFDVMQWCGPIRTVTRYIRKPTDTITTSAVGFIFLDDTCFTRITVRRAADNCFDILLDDECVALLDFEDMPYITHPVTAKFVTPKIAIVMI